MYGYVCKHCGARLDPGEKCDCEEEKRRLPELYSRVGKNGWKEEKDTSAVRMRACASA